MPDYAFASLHIIIVYQAYVGYRDWIRCLSKAKLKKCVCAYMNIKSLIRYKCNNIPAMDLSPTGDIVNSLIENSPDHIVTVGTYSYRFYHGEHSVIFTAFAHI